MNGGMKMIDKDCHLLSSRQLPDSLHAVMHSYAATADNRNMIR
jgi:hypothetical protein